MFFLERLLVECYMHTNQSSIGQWRQQHQQQQH
jgi:hypothetical protein